MKPGEIEFDWGKKHDQFAMEQCSLEACNVVYPIIWRTPHPF